MNNAGHVGQLVDMSDTAIDLRASQLASEVSDASVRPGLICRWGGGQMRWTSRSQYD